MKHSDIYRAIIEKYIHTLEDCRVCPRNCGINRIAGQKGYCGADAGFNISSICIHHGEEPPVSGLKGICNVFFSRCNLQCKYCQNWQISRRKGEVEERAYQLEEVVEQIIKLLDQGCKSVGFVSPSHYIPQVKMIIDALRSVGRTPVFIYNTNSYDLASEIRGLEGFIDVFLPDFKYGDAETGKKLSGVKDYPERALNAIKEMYRQKGSTLQLDDEGCATSGIIIRHLILPSLMNNSVKVLEIIAHELSFTISLSLMAQYWPVPHLENHPELGRLINEEEYDLVVEKMESLGFYKGWVQELNSHGNYRPDFRNRHPFETQ
jgi:putative pyruvate formate lyase activating enzyme